MDNKELKLGGGQFSSSEDLLTKFYSKSPYIPETRPRNWYQNTEFNSGLFWKQERSVDEGAPFISPVMRATYNSQLNGPDYPRLGAPKARLNNIYNGDSLMDYGYWDGLMIPSQGSDAPPEVAQNALQYPRMKIG